MAKKGHVRLLPAPECWFAWGVPALPRHRACAALSAFPPELASVFLCSRSLTSSALLCQKSQTPTWKDCGRWWYGVGEGGSLLCGFMLDSADVHSLGVVLALTWQKVVLFSSICCVGQHVDCLILPAACRHQSLHPQGIYISRTCWTCGKWRISALKEELRSDSQLIPCYDLWKGEAGRMGGEQL